MRNYSEIATLRNLTIDWLTLVGMFLPGVDGMVEPETVANLLRIAAHFLNVRDDRLQILACRIIQETNRVASMEDWRQVGDIVLVLLLRIETFSI